ncbi:Uncharacterized conserved protein, DUF302 family [Modicisalibacter ilicicola DSM 19980]|uniref:Uncharacterized conserved protein, DUF302 family n=1 Tax=Modicisalibacter ilicicola DSM 19980 TaxID=1121942 RepID=A0A1M4ZVY6_9GAMM|nr:DUF302 domain-containing protein [Halomonas ilicicola]SHF22171.1 Uncharacterized conserved protein, DUF302 family [Halomonas ilicicola DSM 19980]
MKARILKALAPLVLVGSASLAAAEQPESPFPGIAHVSSQASVAEVETRLREALESRGLTLFTVVDHTQNAEKVDMQLPPVRTVIFGNPKVGTPLMQCQGSTALDLPQKMVIREDGDTTRIEWNDPAYLAERHELQECDLPLKKIADVLKGVAQDAAGAKQ